MPVKLNSSGGGSVTIDVPSTASAYTLTAPAANATLITTGSSGQIIPKAALPTGSVLQVVSATGFGGVSIGGSAASVLSASITPTSSSSKILISAGTVVHRDGGGSNGWYWEAKIYKNNINTNLFIVADAILYQSPGDGFRAFCGGEYLDSPATTSSVTYGIRAERMSGSGTATFNQGSSGYITLMEIAA